MALVYSQTHKLDLYIVSDEFRATIIDSGRTEFQITPDSQEHSLGLFPLHAQSKNIRTEGWGHKAEVGFEFRHFVRIRVLFKYEQ